VGKYKDFKFGVLVGHSKSQPTDDKLFLLNAFKHSWPAVAQFFKVQNCACRNGSHVPYL